MTTDLLLIRHGQAIRTHGDYARAPLTDIGREQAISTGRYLAEIQEQADGYYSSPLPRAKETAVLIGNETGWTPKIQDGLQEMMFYEFGPIVLLETLARVGLFQTYLKGNIGKPLRWPIVGRAATVLTRLIAKHTDESIVLVTHGGIISGTLAWYMPMERRRWWRDTVDNCSLTRLRVRGTLAELEVFNDARHLKPSKVTKLLPEHAAAIED